MYNSIDRGVFAVDRFVLVLDIFGFDHTFRYHAPSYIDYKTRLLRLGVDSLEIRRLRQDLIYTYKIVFGLVTNAGIEFSH